MVRMSAPIWRAPFSTHCLGRSSSLVAWGTTSSEARKVIEPAIAELAAKRAERQDLDALGEAYGKMVSSQGNPEALADADLAFHLTLAKIARNRLFHETILELQHLLRPLMTATLMSRSEREAALGQHAAILEGVREKNPAKAREAIDQEC